MNNEQRAQVIYKAVDRALVAGHSLQVGVFGARISFPVSDARTSIILEHEICPITATVMFCGRQHPSSRYSHGNVSQFLIQEFARLLELSAMQARRFYDRFDLLFVNSSQEVLSGLTVDSWQSLLDVATSSP